MSDVCLVQLGRYGDICNMLPIAHHLAKTQAKPSIMVSWEFDSILDGISYATPHPVNLTFHQLNDALRLARQRFRTVVQCQIYGGPEYVPSIYTPHYNMESWMRSGFLNEFGNPEWKLTFDKRNPQRERSVLRKLFRTDLPKIVTNLTRAASAPLPIAVEILAELKRRFECKYEVVDVGALKLTRIFDVVGVIEKAVLFVTIDTATLHLAGACNVPMIALVRDGWVGSEPRFGCVKKFTYSEVNADWKQVVTSVETQLCK